ncbi:helix-turn-helix domain-containing protein [Streptomyces sp. S07_1.15]|nr:helix-turn-helix domain-containing protein [Streptomyces sp. S07_1.15]
MLRCRGMPSPMTIRELMRMHGRSECRTLVPGLGAEHLHILQLLSQGCTMAQVARRLGVSERTLRRRLRVICEHVQVDTPVEAVVWAVRRHIL